MKILFIFLTTQICFSFQSIAEPLQIQTSTQTVAFDVEVANTPEIRQTGLMNRNSLPQNTGMLFVFEEITSPQFWMKDTKIKLDMVYIGEDGLVKGIHENAIPFDKTPIPSPAPVLAVLEIAGGSAKTLGISKGDKVIHQIFEKDLK